MGLKEDFESCSKDNSGNFYARGDVMLEYAPGWGPNLRYDFLSRLLLTSNSNGVNTTPFSQLDPEVLEFMRDKLIELGGKPPALAGNKIEAGIKLDAVPKPVNARTASPRLRD